MKKTGLSLVLYSIVLCSLLPQKLYADKIEQGFKALSVYDYYKAYELFHKELKNESVSATFGMSVLHSRSPNHFYNLDSAYSYILECKSSYLSLLPEQRLKLAQKTSQYPLNGVIQVWAGVDSGSITRLQDTIEQMAFRALLTYPFSLYPTIDGYNHYLSFYKTSDKESRVIEMRNALAFDIAKKENTYQAYDTFMKTYPQAVEYVQAKKKYELLLYKSLTSPHTVQSYADFIVNYPQSPFEQAAEDSVYKLYNHTTVEDYHQFVKTYPKNRNVADAWRKIYSIYTMDGKPETFKHFQETYPDYPFIQHADSDLILSQTVFFPAKKGSQWGYIDSAGRVRIPCQYEWVDTGFFNGLASVALNDKFGFINKRGELVIPFIYDEADRFSKTITIVKKGGLYGIISSIGRVIVPFEYQEILEFSEGRAQVEKNNLFGFINMLGDEVIPAKYSDATDFSEGLASVEGADNKYGYINKDGKTIISFNYEWADKFYHGVAKVKENGKFGLIDRNGNLLLPCIYDNIGDFSDSLAMVVKDLKIGYCAMNGTITISPDYDFAIDLLGSGNFINGFAKVQLHKKRGFIDESGKLAVPCKYDEALNFSQGLAPVMLNKKWGYINEKGKLVIPCKYKQAYPFSDSLARVQIDSLEGYIDLNGNEQIAPQFNAANDFTTKQFWQNMALVQINGKYGLIDKAGNFIEPCLWNDTKFIARRGLLKVTINDKMAYYNLQAKRYLWQEDGFGK